MERYERNKRIPGFGEAGQAALMRARVLIIGAGGLGCPALLYLCAAGVGTLGVADGDTVSLSNLQRQILYTEREIGRNKAAAACAALERQNSGVQTVCLPERLSAERMEALLPGWDCVLDCTDVLKTKLLINDLCVKSGVPLVHAGVSGLSGQVMSIAKGHACLRCALPAQEEDAPVSHADGVLGAAAGAVGAIQAAEAVKLITGLGEPIFDALLHLDLARGQALRLAAPKKPRCPACGKEGAYAE